ncbi:SDR family NAD(P)-dependent oxidoreductase [Enemella sp. A6]|uniref:SDR family NAD(P)-dependent oxidoreductase n=1 Tax=Enemella sp. A6 TaxID=3440152 RepID=UPI003EB90EA2
MTDRVVVVTGAGRGMGREHALLAAQEGASVVVNDSGVDADGTNPDASIAEKVAAEITAAGGTAIADTHDVATTDGAQALLESTLDKFGAVHGLVTNAGILRDKMFVNMSDDDWDTVITGQLRATFAPVRAFAAHWRGLSKSGTDPQASVVTVSSTSGLLGQVGQSNYGAAKAGVAAMTLILAEEFSRYGTRINSLVPVARTRMTEDLPGIGEMVAAPSDPNEFDVYHPGNVSPLVAWLLTADCPKSGAVYYAKGGEIRRFRGWSYDWTIDQGQRWTVAELDAALRDRD